MGNTENPISIYLNTTLSTWMYCAATIQLSVICIILRAFVIYYWNTVHDHHVIFMIYILLCWIFMFVWTAIGIRYYVDIQSHGVNDQQCSDILLAWIILNTVMNYGPVI